MYLHASDLPDLHWPPVEVNNLSEDSQSRAQQVVRDRSGDVQQQKPAHAPMLPCHVDMRMDNLCLQPPTETEEDSATESSRPIREKRRNTRIYRPDFVALVARAQEDVNPIDITTVSIRDPLAVASDQHQDSDTATEIHYINWLRRTQFANTNCQEHMCS